MTSSLNSQVNKKKKKKYRVDYVRVLLIVCLVYFSITFVKQQFEINEYNVKIDGINQEIANAEAKTNELNEIKKNVDDPAFIEKIAREECGLVKPHERIFIDVSK
ncbi:MAG: septum formation initiator family protein [Clostridia bacterium]|nr:septum formation initiator family protein [Clostridia bacterium]